MRLRTRPNICRIASTRISASPDRSLVNLPRLSTAKALSQEAHMKRLLLSLFSLPLLFTLATQTLAQQRLALLPTRFTLNGEGRQYEAEAFCLDRHLVQSTR